MTETSASSEFSTKMGAGAAWAGRAGVDAAGAAGFCARAAPDQGSAASRARREIRITKADRSVERRIVPHAPRQPGRGEARNG